MSKVRLFSVVLALVIAIQAPFVRATPEVWKRSYTLETQGDNRGALEAIETLPATERQGYLFSLRHAWLLYLVGRFDDSVTNYRAAATVAPSAVEPLVGELLPLMALRRWQDAETRARAAIRLDPNNYLANRRLALSLYNLGRFDAALVVYRQVSEKYPSDLEMVSGIGWCQLRLNHKTEAAEAFRNVLAISEDTSARSGLTAAAAP